MNGKGHCDICDSLDVLIARVETFPDGDAIGICIECDRQSSEDCGHDGEDTDPNCPNCQKAIRQSALDAGIPASVSDGKTKLSDHFSPQYIDFKCNRAPEGEGDE